MATIDNRFAIRYILPVESISDDSSSKSVSPEEIIPILVEIQRRAESMTDFYERLVKKGYQIVKI